MKITPEGEPIERRGAARLVRKPMHLAIYRERADIRAVVHAHPRPRPASPSQQGLDQPFLPEVSSVPARHRLCLTHPGATNCHSQLSLISGSLTLLLGYHGWCLWPDAARRDVQHGDDRAERAHLPDRAQLGNIRFLDDAEVAALRQRYNSG